MTNTSTNSSELFITVPDSMIGNSRIRSLITRGKIGVTDFMLLCLIQGLSQKKGQSDCSQSYLADRLHVSRRAIADSIRTLMDNGLIEQRAGGNGAICHYAATIPTCEDMTSQVSKEDFTGTCEDMTSHPTCEDMTSHPPVKSCLHTIENNIEKKDIIKDIIIKESKKSFSSLASGAVGSDNANVIIDVWNTVCPDNSHCQKITRTNDTLQQLVNAIADAYDINDVAKWMTTYSEVWTDAYTPNLYILLHNANGEIEALHRCYEKKLNYVPSDNGNVLWIDKRQCFFCYADSPDCINDGYNEKDRPNVKIVFRGDYEWEFANGRWTGGYQ